MANDKDIQIKKDIIKHLIVLSFSSTKNEFSNDKEENEPNNKLEVINNELIPKSSGE